MLYNRLLLIRTEAGLSRQELAALAEVHYQTIGFIERGDYSPSLELAFRIARTLKTDVTTIFSDQPFEPVFVKNNGKGANNEET